MIFSCKVSSCHKMSPMPRENQPLICCCCHSVCVAGLVIVTEPHCMEMGNLAEFIQSDHWALFHINLISQSCGAPACMLWCWDDYLLITTIFFHFCKEWFQLLEWFHLTPIDFSLTRFPWSYIQSNAAFMWRADISPPLWILLFGPCSAMVVMS